MAVIIRKAIVSDATQMANIHALSWETAYVDIIPKDVIGPSIYFQNILEKVLGNLQWILLVHMLENS